MAHTSRWPILSGLLLVVGLSMTAGCGNPPTPAPETDPLKPVIGGTYRRAFSDAFFVLDPSLVADSYSHEVCRQMFDGLVEFDAEGKVVPSIAEKWEISSDRLTYTIKLRSDCRFQAVSGPEDKPTLNGGRQVIADDVSYTFHRLLSPENSARRGKLFNMIKGARDFNEGKAATIEGIAVPASDTVVFTLEKPFSPFLSLLALVNTFIIPREDADALGKGFAAAPVGTGPFSWAGRQGSTMVLKANPTYFRGRPYLDRVEFPIIESEKERFAAFKRGELMHSDVPDPEYKNVKQDPKWSVLFQEVSRWGIYYLGFNVEKAPFDNVKVRQAINFAIDRDGIVRLILNERARVANGVLPPGIMGYNPQLKGYAFDPAKARALMAEAGYPEGKGFPEITLQFNRDPQHGRTSELVVANLRDIGINCSLREVDFQEHLKTVEDGTSSFFRMGWTVDYPDPDNFLYSLFHSSNIGPGGNFSRYRNPQLDEVLERARFEIEPKDRIPLYQRAEQIVVEDAPWVFVYHYTTHVLTQPGVHGVTITPMGSPFILYRKIWLSPPPAKP